MPNRYVQRFLSQLLHEQYGITNVYATAYHACLLQASLTICFLLILTYLTMVGVLQRVRQCCKQRRASARSLIHSLGRVFACTCTNQIYVRPQSDTDTCNELQLQRPRTVFDKIDAPNRRCNDIVVQLAERRSSTWL